MIPGGGSFKEVITTGEPASSPFYQIFGKQGQVLQVPFPEVFATKGVVTMAGNLERSWVAPLTSCLCCSAR